MEQLRTPYINNALFVLACFFILSHLLMLSEVQFESFIFIYNFLSSFTLPSLALFVGYFSKRFLEQDYIRTITLTLLFPYLLFQFLFHYLQDVPLSWSIPVLGLWILLSAYTWNLLLYIFEHLKHPLLMAFFISLLSGTLDGAGAEFSLLRTFVFFPFFLIGFQFKKQYFNVFQQSVSRWIGSAAGILVFLFLVFSNNSSSLEFLSGEQSYNSLQIAYAQGILLRSFYYIVMVLGTVFFLSWIPRRTTFYTSFGKYFITIYILHTGTVLWIQNLGWPELGAFWHLLLSPVLAFIIALILGSPFVRKYAEPLATGKLFLKIASIFDFKKSHNKK